MIYTARTVASRLPLIADQFEQNVTHDPPRKTSTVPYAEYLKIHYKGLNEMPGDEADGCEPDVSPFEIATAELADIRPGLQADQRRRLAGRARPCRKPGLRLRAEEHDRPELEDHAASPPSTATNTSRRSTLSSTSFTNTKPRKADGPIHSTRRPSRRTSSPTTPCWRWPRPAAGLKPTSTWPSPSKPCWPRNGRKAVGKAIPSTRDSTRPSAPRSLR